jgi:hypothetical protein
MKAYYIDDGDIEDLKYAMRLGNKKMMQRIIHDIEFRGERREMSRADIAAMLSDFS